MDQTFQLFSECMLFRHLERRDIEALFSCARIRDFVAGQTICGIGSPAESIMIVLRGKVQTTAAAPGHRPILLPDSAQTSVTSPGDQPLRNTVCPGEIFGEIALSQGGARLADAIALTECTLAIIDRHDMLTFLEQNSDAWQDIASVLRERLRNMTIGLKGRQQYAELTEIVVLHEQQARMR
jgi:CRP/FNR family transcriptional regulator, cyclic AMP receptor protein